MTASFGSLPESSRARRKIAACGFCQPMLCELTMWSIASASPKRSQSRRTSSSPRPERVGDQDNRKAVRLAPCQRLSGSGNERADQVERDRDRGAQTIDVEIIDADLAVSEPLRRPAVRFLT